MYAARETLAGGQRRLRLAAREHLVDEAVLERLVRDQDLVAVDVFVHFLDALVRVLRQRLFEPLAQARDASFSTLLHTASRSKYR